MKIKHNILLTPLFVLTAMLMVACSKDVATDESLPLPEGMGQIRITICAPETVGSSNTRAVEEDPNDQNRPGHENPWETPDHEWERLQTFRIYICDALNVVKQIISGNKSEMTTSVENGSTYKYTTKTSDPLTAGFYHIFATANFHSSDASNNSGNSNDEYDDGYAVGSTITPDATKQFANSSCYYIVGSDYDSQYDVKNIPMTGWLSKSENSTLIPKPIEVVNGTVTNAGTISLWRVIGKMQFEFTNESDRDVKILGIEVDPVNKVSTNKPGIFLFSKDNLESTDNLAPVTGVTLPADTKSDMGPVEFVPAQVGTPAVSLPLTLAAKNNGNTDEGKLYFYVNESDATFTTTQNQLSLRFKVQRKKNDNEWYEEEIRYGVTTHHDLTNGGSYGGTNGGFNVIRRNDWIHIPVVLTDWQLRIEPLAFVPIAGYPATTVSSDALTATFSTGGMIALQPFVKKYSETIWRDFGNSEVEFVDISWKNSDGTNQSGDGKIVKTAFTYDDVTKCVIGELNQAKVGHDYMTTFVVNVKLGPTNDATQQYGYSFTFNVILQ